MIIEAEGVYDGAPGKSEFLGTIGIARNISDFKRAQQELRKALDYAQNIVDCSLDMIVATDIDRHIIEFNRSACDTFGYTRKEVMGKHVNMLYADEKLSDEIASEVLKNGEFIGEILNIRKNKETFTSLLSVSVMRDENGGIIVAVGNSCDIDSSRR